MTLNTSVNYSLLDRFFDLYPYGGLVDTEETDSKIGSRLPGSQKIEKTSSDSTLTVNAQR